ncbi:MAG: uroporphyrinogen decarboxylase [Firmicutes bacterium]|nr:uroporphyrinogen decarboxylase [Bacillota bacterium]
MTRRERVVRAINHQEPDYVPLDLGGGGAGMLDLTYYKMMEHLGFEEDGSTVVIPTSCTIQYYDERLLSYLDTDFRRIYLKSPYKTQARRFDDGRFKDDWGITFKRSGLYSCIVEHPLRDMDARDLDNYTWPDPDDPGRVRGIEDEAKHLYHNTDFAVVAGAPVMGTFMQACRLRGMEDFLVDLMINQEFANKLLDIIADITIGLMDAFLSRIGKYVQIVQIQDDLGTQSAPLMSPDIYRKMIKPRHGRIIAAIKRHTDAKIYMHSDGAIFDLIPDLIDAGVDILNPVQPLAAGMDSHRLKEAFGDRLCFHGGIDQQQVLAFGTPADVEEEVRKRIQALGPGGGYIIAPSNNLQPDASPENIIALFRAARKWGKYPISR